MRELTVDAIIENIEKVTDFVNEELEKLDYLKLLVRNQYLLVLEELKH